MGGQKVKSSGDKCIVVIWGRIGRDRITKQGQGREVVEVFRNRAQLDAPNTARYNMVQIHLRVPYSEEVTMLLQPDT